MQGWGFVCWRTEKMLFSWFSWAKGICNGSCSKITMPVSHLDFPFVNLFWVLYFYVAYLILLFFLEKCKRAYVVIIDLIRIIGFDHRKSSLSKIPSPLDCPENLKFHFDVEKSSSNAVYEYFSHKLEDMKSPDVSRTVNVVFLFFESFIWGCPSSLMNIYYLRNRGRLRVYCTPKTEIVLKWF